MADNPYWEPSSLTLSALASNMKVQPATNWGCAENRDGLRAFSVGHVWLNADLTPQDVRLITRLRLNPFQHNPLICGIFDDLMQTLPNALCPGGETRKVRDLWVDELLCLMPPCDHNRMEIKSAAECAKTYIDRGMAPLLMPLYMLMLRGDTWIRRIQRSTVGPMRSMVPVPVEFTGGHDLHELIGDPCATRQLQGGWTMDFMESRERFFTGYGLNEAVTRQSVEAVKDLLFSLDTMAHVAASLSPVLDESMTTYDRWSTQF